MLLFYCRVPPSEWVCLWLQVEHQPVYEHNVYMYLYLVFFAISCFFMLNFFIRVIVSNLQNGKICFSPAEPFLKNSFPCLFLVSYLLSLHICLPFVGPFNLLCLLFSLYFGEKYLFMLEHQRKYSRPLIDLMASKPRRSVPRPQVGSTTSWDATFNLTPHANSAKTASNHLFWNGNLRVSSRIRV